MRRVQAQLTEDQVVALETNARATGRRTAAVIREAVELWRKGQDRTRRIERALEAIGGFHSGLHDVAERHDDYLAEALEEEIRERWR
jgi:hypothetical protein